MAAKDSTPAPLARYTGAIPGHMRELRSIAEAAGIVVHFGLHPSRFEIPDEGEESEPTDLCTRLIGAPAAFERAGLTPPDFQCVRYRRTLSGPFPLAFVRTGTDELCADLVEDRPQTIDKRGRVEITTYARETYRGHSIERVYWGSPMAVAKELSLPADRIAPGKRNISRSGYDPLLSGDRWQARFYPSGSVRLLWRDDPPVKTPADSRERGEHYNSPEKFADSCERWLRASVRVAIREISGELERDDFGECTISYDSKTVEAVSAALDHACQLLQAATPGFVGSKRNALQSLESARGDADFQAFMARLLAQRRGTID